MRSVKAATCFCFSPLASRWAGRPAAQQAVTTSDCSKYSTIKCDSEGVEKTRWYYPVMFAGVPKSHWEMYILIIFERSCRSAFLCKLYKLWNDCRRWITRLTSVNINTRVCAIDWTLSCTQRCIFTSHLVNWFSPRTWCHTVMYRRVERKSAAFLRMRVSGKQRLQIACRVEFEAHSAVVDLICEVRRAGLNAFHPF